MSKYSILFKSEIRRKSICTPGRKSHVFLDSDIAAYIKNTKHPTPNKQHAKHKTPSHPHRLTQHGPHHRVKDQLWIVKVSFTFYHQAIFGFQA